MKPYNPQLAAPTLKLFVYGDPGGGKTTLFGTAMDDIRTSPVLMLNCAGNPESIRRRNSMPFIVTLEKTVELNDIYDWFLHGQKQEHPFVAKLKEWGSPYTTFKSIALDSLTEYQRIALDEITGNTNKKLGDDLKPADRQMWGQALARLTKVARLLYGLEGVSVFMSALESRNTDESGVSIIGPNLWGQADKEVPGYALLAMRLVKTSSIVVTSERAKHGASKRVGFLDEAARFFAKDQYGDLPPFIDDVTVPMLMNKIYGEVIIP